MTDTRIPSANCTSKCEGSHEFHFDPPHDEVEVYGVKDLRAQGTAAERWMAGETLEPPMAPLGDIPVAPRRDA